MFSKPKKIEINVEEKFEISKKLTIGELFGYIITCIEPDEKSRKGEGIKSLFFNSFDKQYKRKATANYIDELYNKFTKYVDFLIEGYSKKRKINIIFKCKYKKYINNDNNLYELIDVRITGDESIENNFLNLLNNSGIYSYHIRAFFYTICRYILTQQTPKYLCTNVVLFVYNKNLVTQISENIKVNNISITKYDLSRIVFLLEKQSHLSAYSELSEKLKKLL